MFQYFKTGLQSSSLWEMQLTWSEEKSSCDKWLKTVWKISHLVENSPRDLIGGEATEHWRELHTEAGEHSRGQLVRERIHDGHEEYVGTAGGVRVNYDKSVTDGDIGIFQNVFPKVWWIDIFTFKCQWEKWWGIFFFPYAEC